MVGWWTARSPGPRPETTRQAVSKRRAWSWEEAPGTAGDSRDQLPLLPPGPWTSWALQSLGIQELMVMSSASPAGSGFRCQKRARDISVGGHAPFQWSEGPWRPVCLPGPLTWVCTAPGLRTRAPLNPFLPLCEHVHTDAAETVPELHTRGIWTTLSSDHGSPTQVRTRLTCWIVGSSSVSPEASAQPTPLGSHASSLRQGTGRGGWRSLPQTHSHFP